MRNSISVKIVLFLRLIFLGKYLTRTGLNGVVIVALLNRTIFESVFVFCSMSFCNNRIICLVDSLKICIIYARLVRSMSKLIPNKVEFVNQTSGFSKLIRKELRSFA